MAKEEIFGNDNFIRVRGARQNNLDNLDVDIPRDKLDRGSRRWRLIRFMPRGSGDM